MLENLQNINIDAIVTNLDKNGQMELLLAN